MLITLAGMPMAAFAQEAEIAGIVQSPAIDAEAFRIKAEGQHSLALLYLKNGEGDKAVAEARQIIQSRIPPEFEDAVAMSMSIIAEKLAAMGRFDIAQALLDETFKVTIQIPGRVKILQCKSRLFLKAGENDKAIETWKRAKELEAKIR
jgi:tetratricopeptide (TPR) repeat protein